MKKRSIALVLALTLATSVFATTALAAPKTTNEGYETFKRVMKNMKAEGYENGTVKIEGIVKDNNESLMDVSAVAKFDKDSENMSVNGTINIDGFEKEIQVYKEDENKVLVDVEKDDYYLLVNDEDQESKRHKKSTFSDSQKEEMIDYLIGDIKNKFEITKLENDNQEISLELSNEEIPKMMKMLVSYKMENGKDKDKDFENCEYKKLSFFEGFDFESHNKLNLVDEVEIENIALHVILDENEKIVRKSLSFTVSGEDEEKVAHTITAEFNMEVLEKDNTVVDTIDLTDKDVIEIDKSKCEK